MILVDTSVWVDHLRYSNVLLVDLLHQGLVLGHPWITGELALGSLANRDKILTLLQALPQACIATNLEVMQFIDNNKLFGLGIGFVDAHLLASAKLTQTTQLWTQDKRLHTTSQKFGLAYVSTH